MDEPTLALGDRVTNNKLATPILGFVAGMIPADAYVGGQEWDEIYFGWRDKYVIYVKLDVPTAEGNEYYIFPEDDLVLLDSIGVD